MNRIHLALAAALLPVAPAAASARAEQWQAPAADSVERLIRARVEARGGGILVGAVLGQGEPRIVSAGLPGGSAADSAIFEIGSISKVFTTTLLAEMAVRGELGLDDPIRKYLPDSVRAPAWEGREISLRDLATATSGLPRLPTNFDPADPADPYADYTVADLYAFLSGYALTRAPGAAYEYSNLGMGLLGHLLERSAGKPYEALVTERILAPLGMRDTWLTVPPGARARFAQGHDGDLTPVPAWTFDVIAPAGGWRSTAADMVRFAAAAARPPAGPLGEALRLAMAPERPTGSPNLSVGLGWHVRQPDGRRIVWHNGQTAGAHSFLGVLGGEGAVLLLGNVGASDDDLGFHLLDPGHALRAPRIPLQVDGATLEQYVGRYLLSPAFAIDVTREGDRLFAQATGQPRVRLYAASERRFFLRVVEAEIEFDRDGAGAVTGLVLHQAGRAMPGRRVTPAAGSGGP